MTRRWPDTFPPLSVDSLQVSPQDQSRRTDMEVGAPRVRRITEAELDRISVVWVMNQAQMTAFYEWFRDRQVSLAGASDSLSAWAMTRATRSAGAALSPDLIAIDRLLETTDTGAHYASLALPGAAYDNVTLLARASFRAAGRSKARLSIIDRAGVAKGVDVDLTTGAPSNASGAISATVEARDDYWRVTLTASTGTGIATPSMRLQCLDATGTQNYAGTATLGLDICEVQARIATGQDLFVPSDADGKARGAAGGSAWVWMPIAVKGVMTVAEAQFAEMYKAQGEAGLNWTVSGKLLVRNA